MALVESDAKISVKGKKNGEDTEITIFEVSFAFDESVPEEVSRAITQEVSLTVMDLLNG
jgi:hypothetical protein